MYHIGVYINYFCNVTPKILAEFVSKNELDDDSEDVSPEVGKSSWWSEILHVNQELTLDHENV